MRNFIQDNGASHSVPCCCVENKGQLLVLRDSKQANKHYITYSSMNKMVLSMNISVWVMSVSFNVVTN